MEDRIGWLLVHNHLQQGLRELDFERARVAGASPLLPEVASPNAAPQGLRSGPASASLGSLMTRPPLTHILCADDDADMRMILEVALQTIGEWRVSLAADGEQALAAARADRPDLILLDASMAGVDGPSALANLRADPGLADVPVMFVTGHASPHEVAAYRALGAVDVITKPFDPIGLAERVRVIWAALPHQASRELRVLTRDSATESQASHARPPLVKVATCPGLGPGKQRARPQPAHAWPAAPTREAP
ncbi:MAG: response regulator [Aquimonas sp.]|nr:response regulator [Aquimonas sp.]